MRFEGLIFDFDGVLIESEYVGNKQIADYLTAIGHPTSVEESMNHFMGLSGDAFLGAIERWIGRPLPDDFHSARADEDARVLAEGLEEVGGAVAFILGLPPDLPRAIASSSSMSGSARISTISAWPSISATRCSAAPSMSRAASRRPTSTSTPPQALGVDIARTAIIEDLPVGVRGAVASGAEVIGLCAGRHCLPGHAERLRALGVHHIAHVLAAWRRRSF